MWNGRRDRDGCPDRGKPLISIGPARVATLEGALFRKSGSLTSAGRKQLTAAAAYLRALGARKARVLVRVAPPANPDADDSDAAKRRTRSLVRVLARKNKALDIVVEERPAADGARLTITAE